MGLSRGWLIGIVAVVTNIGTTGAMLYSQKDTLFPDLTAVESVEPSAPPLLWSFSDNEVEKFVSELRDQRKKLETREGDMEKLSAQLASERDELRVVRNDIQVMRDQLSAAILEVQESEVKNLKSLSQTYSAVSAPAAVAILCEMDETMAVKLLSLMKADKVGAIFQEMARAQTPDGVMVKRAARMSDKLRLLKASKKDTQKP